jgi:protein-S-isoprenylcysteine O-methyltransferase Ste14
VSLIEFTRVYLAAFFTFVAGFYTFRIIYKNRNTPSGVIFVGKKYCANWWNHLVFRIFRVVIWGVCVMRVFIPAIDHYLAVFTPLNTWPTVILGNILLTAGFIVVMLVHFNLATLWRSGVDPQGPNELKVNGFYKYSRNPMYLGVAAAQLGFFLALPSGFSLLCLAVGLTALYRQVLVEETHLAATFKQHYTQYQQRVPRWL